MAQLGHDGGAVLGQLGRMANCLPGRQRTVPGFMSWGRRAVFMAVRKTNPSSLILPNRLCTSPGDPMAERFTPFRGTIEVILFLIQRWIRWSFMRKEKVQQGMLIMPPIATASW